MGREAMMDDDDTQQYAHQRQWVGLTDEEIVSAIYEVEDFADGLVDCNMSDETVLRYARVVEAKLKGRNHG
jgi:hypothetical protein